MRLPLVITLATLFVSARATAQTQDSYVPTAAAAQEQPQPQPQSSLPTRFTRQTAFNIPFSVDLSRGAPTEVQLFVSQDAGKTWRFYMRRPPNGRTFPFRTTGDGHFWFAPRTIDPHRNAPRVDQLKPELYVVVDTQQPRVDFTAFPGQAGEVTTAWKIADTSGDVKALQSTLKIEYQAAPNGPWRQVAIDRTKIWAAGGAVVGEMAWLPDGESRAVTVRAEVADAAGNKTIVNRQVAFPATLARKPQSNATSESNLPRDPYADVVDTSGTRTTSPWGNCFGSTDAATPDRSGSQDGESTYVVSAPGDWTTEKRSADDSQDMSNDAGGYAAVRGSTFPPLADQVSPNQPIENHTYDHPETRSLPSGLPPGERPSMTNSLQFQLDYELDAVGPRGVDEVQLWGTTDYGRTWTNWSLDDDRESPIEVEVEREGTYGFRVVIVGRNGLATPPPNPGEPADVWVAVDVTEPAVRITSAIYGEGIHAGELDIRWLASDDALGDRPITLMFSEQPAGKWTTIAAGLPNTGQYFWKVDRNVPQKIYLRLEVYDDAGNLGDHQLVEPVNTRGLIPKAIIRSVRPVAPKTEANRSSGYRYR